MHILNWWWTGVSPRGDTDPDPHVPRPMARSDVEVYEEIAIRLDSLGIFDLVLLSTEAFEDAQVPSSADLVAHVRQNGPSRSRPDSNNRHRRIVSGRYTLTVAVACSYEQEGRMDAWRRLQGVDAMVRRAIQDPSGYDGLVFGPRSDLGDREDILDANPNVRSVYRSATFSYVIPRPDLYPTPGSP